MHISGQTTFSSNTQSYIVATGDEKKLNLGFANFCVKFLSVNFACPFETKQNYSTKEDERNKITGLGQTVQLKANWFHFCHVSYNNFPPVA